MKKVKENIDMDMIADQELMKLQRQYRIMEGDKAAYQGLASSKLRRQIKLIDILENEQTNLIADLDIATSKSKKKQDKRQINSVTKLLEEYECLGRSIEKERSHLTEIDYQILKLTKQIREIKKRTITDEQCQARIINGRKSVIVLENQLETNLRKFNTTVAENYELRKDIDHLLIERAKFNTMWDRMIHSLVEGKKFMIDVIEQATSAYEQREEWCTKLQALKTKGNFDIVEHTQQITNLQRKLDYKEGLREFLGAKGTKRMMKNLYEKNEKKKKQAKEKLEQQFARYQEIIKEIQNFCGESDMVKVAAKFVKHEEENFAIFNYINELNHECETISSVIDELKHGIETQKELNKEQEKSQRESVEELKATLEEEFDKSRAAQEKHTNMNEMLETLYEQIFEMFNFLKCDYDPILQLLFGTSETGLVTVNKYNVMIYLNILEKRTIELIQIVCRKEEEETEKIKDMKKKPHITRLIKADQKTRYVHNSLVAMVPSQPCPLCVDLLLVHNVHENLEKVQVNKIDVEKSLDQQMKRPHALERLHNVSKCHLPASRAIVQQRFM